MLIAPCRLSADDAEAFGAHIELPLSLPGYCRRFFAGCLFCGVLLVGIVPAAVLSQGIYQAGIMYCADYFAFSVDQIYLPAEQTNFPAESLRYFFRSGFPEGKVVLAAGN